MINKMYSGEFDQADIIGLTSYLSKGIIRLAEGHWTVGICTLITRNVRYEPNRRSNDIQSVPAPSHPLKYLWIKVNRLKTSETRNSPEARGNRESVTGRFDPIYNGLMLGESETYGGIREISALEPLPAVVGFCRVASTRVQPSPLKPQAPKRGGSFT